MSVYTRGGDKGDTSLLGGVRVPKDSLRIEVYGTLDEATSMLGLARATSECDDLCRMILDLQGEFIDVMGELASGPFTDAPVQLPKGRSFRVDGTHVARLEQWIDALQAERLPAHHFVRPGGSPAAAALDVARTFVRRAERRLVTLSREEPVNPQLVIYFNRLSDLFYMMARIDEQRCVARAVERQLVARTPSSTGGSTMTALTLAACDRMVDAGVARAGQLGIAVVLAVADAAGQLVELRRMDDALVVSLTLAPAKAHTAAAVRLPTQELARLSQPGGPLYGIDANSPGITLVGGGLPLLHDRGLVGAVGVSGGSVEQDIEVASAMAAAFQALAKDAK
ncbi:cob(I)yrinic acid a,c-diamide adenosyltransferase [Siculibacillus lacustris]|uniref:Cob(I)yrinic acid a,c-diamide adenosyltransferase n=1 Tax=Siculibacillus lacustris TaxID=1549641 RepID=A0A4Q9VMH8_9HYPH|nr:cob(I)yrinic acid a,c-diamide adenosyltransferase [Siculibacillus lacustris]TBW36776.1 cob(I)yrinic acid a,c-diamide adenosyltransferase [Siculibacillus lacustris]